MKKIILLLLALKCTLLNSFAQLPFAKTIAIGLPDSLTKNADAVVREDYMKFRVKNAENATAEYHIIVTVLNENGSDHLNFVNYSDKFRSLEDAEIRVYNVVGKELNKYTKKEMQSFAYGDGLVEDGKITMFRVSAASYPITIEQTWTVKYKGLLDYPDNYILGPGESKEHFLFDVEVPADLGLRYKMINSGIVPEIVKNGDVTSYRWETKNLTAIKKENGSGPSERNFPRVAISPNKFKIGGYEGSMSSWKNFGQFSYDLIGQRNTLSEKNQQTIRELIKNAGSDKEKEQIVYNYLQRNMRYVSIQLGIGGWQPFPADFVQEKKYGDCKALSNYMQAALKVAGIKSYYALINAGDNEVSAAEDFPTNMFNHVILCVPNAKDTTWLECTSANTGFGVLGNFTENRKALLITENGGVLVSTPKSTAQANNFLCVSKVKLNEDGSGNIASTLSSTGEFRLSQLYIDEHSNDERLKYLVRKLGWKHPEKCSINPGNKFESTYANALAMDYEKLYTFKTGSKMFLPLRLYSFFDEKIIDNENRKQDYFFDFPYIKSDTTIIELPQGFAPETLPKEKMVSTGFGKYSGKYFWDEATHRVTIVAMLQIDAQQIKAADYTKLMAFKKEVDADLNQKLIVKKGD